MLTQAALNPPHSGITRTGLSLNGQPVYLLSGVIHYFRWPKGEWRDILVKAKASGLNTIDTVIPWNLHEPEPERFNFEAEADLPAYLDLIHELGLYAIVRPGPYICAEWENGGFPAWLTAQALQLRTDDPLFLAAVQRWFDRLLPDLAARQIDRGGPIILCQIENEHWASGVYGHAGHQASLARLQIEGGLTVPFYTCMGALTGYPEFRNGWSGLAAKLQATRSVWPDNPMIVSELWSGWFDNWGSSAHKGKTAASLDRILHELTAVGCSGVSHWVFAGGTNFGWWGGRTVGGDTIHMTTSYDYDAPINEYGQLTAKFYTARRHHLFLSTLGINVSHLLADAHSGGPAVIVPPAVSGRWAGGELPYRTIRTGDLSATFLQNTSAERQTVQVFNTAPNVHLSIEVEALSIKPIYFNLDLSTLADHAQSAVRIKYHTSRLLGCWPQTLVCYGFQGEAGSMQLEAAIDWQILDADNAPASLDGKTLTVRYWITDRPTIIRTNLLTIVLLTQERAERWWSMQDGSFLCGPDLVLEDGTSTDTGVKPFYSMKANAEITPSAPSIDIALDWETLAVDELSSALESWQHLDRPVSFEQLKCWLDYGWYAARFESPQPIETTLAVPWLSDRGRVFIDGQFVGAVGVMPDRPNWTVPVNLSAGAHDLRLLVDNLGRFNYGSNTGEPKGLLDDVYWGGRQENITAGWIALWQEAAFAGEALANAKPQHVRADALNVDLSNFAFQGAHVWLLREIEVAANEQIMLQLTGDRNSGAVYVNGQALQRFSRHHGGGFIKRDITAHLKPGINIIALHIENYAGLAWQAQLLRFKRDQKLSGEWFFQPGVTAAPRTVDPLAPRFYRARFTASANQSSPLKLDVAGLRKGHLWLNGRSLGRYWQIGPQEFYKVPVSWLRAENELLLFEEAGGTPDRCRLVIAE